MKGHAEIILTDVNTGEVQTFEADNLVTNAVQDLIRLNPAGLNFSGIPWGLPLCPNAIGGVLLFGEEIEEDATQYYAPTDMVPVGYASNAVDTSGDPKRGSYNSSESYRMDNGYRLVFDFGTSDANGEIKCVCLTSSDGGRAYFGSRYLGDDVGWYKEIYINNWNYDDSKGIDTQLQSLEAMDGNNVYGARQLSAYSTEWNTARKHVNDLPLGQGTGLIVQTLETETITYENWYSASGYEKDGQYRTDRASGWTSFSDRAFSCWDGTDMYRVYWVRGTNTCRILRINGGVKSEWTMTWPNVSLENASLATLQGGYIYSWKTDGTGIYKLSATDPTDVTFIELPEGTGTATTKRSIHSGFNGDGPLYTSWRYTVGSAYADYGALIFDTVMERSYYGYSYNWGNGNHKGTFGPILRVGPYALRCWRFNYDYGWSLAVVSPYLATINNITPITKTVAQTMKIVYTLTEE